MGYLLLLIIPMILGFWAQHRVNKTFQTYSQVPSGSGATGAQVARTILDRNGLNDVPVHETPGDLSDHYDPRSRSVHLSSAVYHSNSVSSVSVAAHEVGHAIQHQKSYVPMSFRSALFPLAQFGSNSFSILVLIGIVLLVFANSPLGAWVGLLGVALYGFSVLFHLITLPVEFNASSRARRQLQELGIVGAGGESGVGVGKVLNAAALTYVVGALVSIAALLYYASMFLGGDE